MLKITLYIIYLRKDSSFLKNSFYAWAQMQALESRMSGSMPFFLNETSHTEHPLFEFDKMFHFFSTSFTFNYTSSPVE
jgi:hypothetical protein